MTDRQVPADVNEDMHDNPILDAFSRKSSLATLQFLFDFWPAWMFRDGRRFLPICRIIIGNEDDGSVLMEKPVVITGLLHLADDLANAVTFNIRDASELSGVVMDVPGGEAHVLELVSSLERRLKEIRRLVKGNNLFAPVEDDEQKE